MNTQGEAASIVAIVGMILASLGITGIDSQLLNGVVNGIISAVAIGAAIWSWYQHRKVAKQQ